MSPFGNEFELPALFRLELSDGTFTPAWRQRDQVQIPQGNEASEAFTLGLVGFEALVGHYFLQGPSSPMTSAGDSMDVAAAKVQGPAILKPGKIMALGRTFPAHARELGNEPPKEPLIFGKAVENIVGDGSHLHIPFQDGERFDNEIELGALIQKELRAASIEETKDAIAGWAMLNDFTWRSEQSRAKASGAPWFVAKNLPGCLPIGSYLLPFASMPDPRPLKFRCVINGNVAQEGDFTGMSQSPVQLISWLSQRVPLLPGDFVALGTPKGVTSVRPNDKIEVSIQGLGSLVHSIIGEA
ncbi:MAG: 2-keto-4-pentenoate hydratase/2-oxohepta-3-ene-1,7-dioic acid hydratase in catechol pathway [Planctomycetota bacterium]|jgi:2-keto-4-pentenoate hydratase/2-oxohepta-3-ene-1,7-dioic acid hydratase in catechol pathway